MTLRRHIVCIEGLATPLEVDALIQSPGRLAIKNHPDKGGSEELASSSLTCNLPQPDY